MRREHIIGAVAIVFGIVTVISGGSVLFGPSAVREAAGDVVPLVLWFNTTSGVVYIAAGVGIMLARPWGRRLAWLLVLALAMIFLTLLGLILAGTAWESRTLFAMLLRLSFWSLAAVLVSRSPTVP